jgi:predicted sulfurtransferase
MIALAAVITRFQADLHARFGERLSADQRRALSAMQRCRSAASPMMQLRCSDCERHTLVPHSCGHRLCPHCHHGRGALTRRVRASAEQHRASAPVR